MKKYIYLLLIIFVIVCSQLFTKELKASPNFNPEINTGYFLEDDNDSYIIQLKWFERPQHTFYETWENAFSYVNENNEVITLTDYAIFRGHLGTFNSTDGALDYFYYSTDIFIESPDNFNNLIIEKVVFSNDENVTVRPEIIDLKLNNGFKFEMFSEDGAVDSGIIFKIYDEYNNLLYTEDFNYDVDVFYKFKFKENKDYSDIIDVKNDYSSLPVINNDFILIEDYELINAELNTYKLYLSNDNQSFSFDINLPNNINLHDFFNVYGELNVSYTMSDNERLLYLQPDHNLRCYYIGTYADSVFLNAGYTIINLSKNTYSVYKNLELNVLTNREKDSNAYAYLFSPLKIEQIYSIEMKFKYQYIYLFLKNGKYIEDQRIYTNDTTVQTNMLWWEKMLFGITYDKYSIDQIQNISYSSIPIEVLNRYETNLNGDLNDLYNYAKFKIHLGQFSEIGTTNYNISDIFVVNIKYLYDGVIYSVDYDTIEQNNDDMEQNNGLIDQIPDISNKLFKFNFDDFFKFAGVNSIGSFLLHLVKFWKESIISYFVLYSVLKILSLFRKR